MNFRATRRNWYRVEIEGGSKKFRRCKPEPTPRKNPLFCRALPTYARMCTITYYPQPDSNRCMQTENLLSWASRRWGLAREPNLRIHPWNVKSGRWMIAATKRTRPGKPDPPARPLIGHGPRIYSSSLLPPPPTGPLWPRKTNRSPPWARGTEEKLRPFSWELVESPLCRYRRVARWQCRRRHQCATGPF